MPAQNDDKRTGQGLATSARKAYQAPRLCCYGDVGDITQAVGTASKTSDGGMGLANKTG